MPAGRALLGEFAAALAGWEWDVALLQEVPPWWPEPLAAAAGAEVRLVLTSRNSLLPVRRAVASRRPDLLKANGGGSNAILARVPVLEHRAQRLTRWPERRWAHAVRLDGGWVVNLHASTHREEWARRDVLRALDLGAAAAAGVRRGFEPSRSAAAGAGARLRPPRRPPVRRAGRASARCSTRGRLSDHAPVRVTL